MQQAGIGHREWKCGAAFVAIAALVAAFASDAALAARSDVKPITVTITQTNVRVSASSAAVGTARFKIVNRSKASRVFMLSGQRTPRIPAGKSANLQVAITSGVPYVYYSVTPGPPRNARGSLSVIELCSNPTDSTVSVQLAERPITLSQSTVPCGSVTFTVTNVGTIVHSFELVQQNPPRTLAMAPRLQPGQTASLVVQFTQRGQVQYFCPETEHTDTYGEFGVLTIT
jgi:hypothetical protein